MALPVWPARRRSAGSACASTIVIAAGGREDRRTPSITSAKSATGTFGSGAGQVDRVDAEAANRCYRRTEASACETGGERRDQILVRMTHRHLAIFRTRVKP